jgi:acyl-CoA dehydrogenase
MTLRPIRNMVNHETNEVFFDNLEIPAENLIGKEGSGFKYILDGLNAERILIAAECIGDGYWFLDKSVEVREGARRVRPPDRQNQGIQFPIAECYMEVEAANLMRYKAPPCSTRTSLRRGGEHGEAPGGQGFWEAANVCLQTHGGFGFAAEYDVERKFRETRLYLVAPISTTSYSRMSPSTCSACRGPFR